MLATTTTLVICCYIPWLLSFFFLYFVVAWCVIFFWFFFFHLKVRKNKFFFVFTTVSTYFYHPLTTTITTTIATWEYVQTSLLLSAHFISTLSQCSQFPLFIFLSVFSGWAKFVKIRHRLIYFFINKRYSLNLFIYIFILIFFCIRSRISLHF